MAMKAECVSCGRTYHCSEAYVAMVRAGRLESVCSYCSGEHDGGDYPPEVENNDAIDEDEENRHKAEYQYGDR